MDATPQANKDTARNVIHVSVHHMQAGVGSQKGHITADGPAGGAWLRACPRVCVGGHRIAHVQWPRVVV